MATFVGDKSNAYTSELPATAFFPLLKVSEFQEQFGFLESESETSITNMMIQNRVNVHRQLKTLMDLHPDLVSRSQELFEDDTTGEVLYKQAVFSFTASALIGKQMGTDATKEAADRQATLNDKAISLNIQGREAIDLILQTDTGYTVDLI